MLVNDAAKYFLLNMHVDGVKACSTEILILTSLIKLGRLLI